MQISNYRGANKWTVISLLAAVGVAVFLRTASYPNFVNPQGGFFFYSPDAYDHLRRITLGVHSFPSVPYFDSYCGYPRGTGQIWSPLFDYLLSAASLLMGGTRTVIETVSFFSNPFYTVVTVIALFFVARKTFGNTTAGIAASFFLALFPGHISYSLPMNFDHHVFEPLAVLILFSIPFIERDEKLRLKGKIVASLCIVLTAFMWRGSTVYWATTFLFVLIRSVVTGGRQLPLDYAQVFAGSSLLLALFCAVNPWSSASDVSFAVVSWFHVIVLLFFSAILFVFSISKNRSIFLSHRPPSRLSNCSLFRNDEGSLLGILRGLSVLFGKGDPWLEFNSEMRGTFSFYGLFYTAGYLSAVWFAAPFATAAALRQWYQTGKQDSYLLAFAVWSPLFLLGLILRYVPIAGIICSLGGGYLFSLAWKKTGNIRQKSLLVAIILALFVPSYPHYRDTVEGYLPPYMRFGLFGEQGVLQWIRNNTPKTSYYLNPVRQPEYGILSNWDLGARIYQLAERPAMATGFGWETHGFYEQAGFFVTVHPEMADSIVRQNRIRYLLLSRRTRLDRYYLIAADAERKGRLPRGIIGDYRPEASMYGRLMLFDGASLELPDVIVPALGSFRLVFETDFLAETNGAGLSYYKVFEAVKGARIVGKGRPGSVISLTLPLLTSRNRAMNFHDVRIADRSGNYSFTVPYSTEARQGGTMPLGGYVISASGTRDLAVKVSEADIEEGRTILLSHR